MIYVIAIIFFFAILFGIYVLLQNKKEKQFPSEELRFYILEMVPYVHSLVEEEKNIFYQKTHDFIHSHKFVGVETEVTNKDKVLVGASIVMMIFRSNIDLSSKIDTIYLSNKPIEGAVQNLGGKAAGFVRQSSQGTDIYLSRLHLIHGFQNLDDNKNVGVHEFAHFIDSLDGKIDGFPLALLAKEDVVEWNLLAQKFMGLIEAGDTLIDRYATKNRSEFFAVSSEFFFENPFLMEKKYPELYLFLAKIYGTNLANEYRIIFNPKPNKKEE